MNKTVIKNFANSNKFDLSETLISACFCILYLSVCPLFGGGERRIAPQLRRYGGYLVLFFQSRDEKISA